MKRTLLCAAMLCALLSPHAIGASEHAAELPRIVHQGDRSALLVDGKPFLILGAQMANSSEWASTLPAVWTAVEKVHANTLGAPVYWEREEPSPGVFDFSDVDELIRQARAHDVRLLLLWFGASKNGQMHYAPTWVKTDTAHYPRLVDVHGAALDILDPTAPATLDADRAAYVALMHHLRAIDGTRHTVIMMQVENEAGSYYADRDHTERGDRLFAQPVPEAAWRMAHKQPGTWREVFGAQADGAFAMWAWASYINSLAEAGKKELPIPAYVNIPAVVTPTTESVHRMLDFYKAAAPAIDVVGADLYDDFSPLYQAMLQAYARPGNPLWVAETGNTESYARYFFYALGHGAIGFSPFSIDSEQAAGHVENYGLLASMDREVAQLNYEGKLKTVVEEPQRAQQVIAFGDWEATVTFGFPQADGQRPPGTPDAHGRVLIAQLAPDKFLVTGIDARVIFHPPGRTVASNHYLNNVLRAEQGEYVAGQWKPSRILNGDETQRGLNFGHERSVVQVTVYTWPGM
jgi:hypothetical protein